MKDGESAFGVRVSSDVTVVVVDELAMSREYLKRVCADESGYSVSAAVGCGAEAIETIVEYRPRLVLLDFELPRRDGFEVIEAVRKAGCTPLVIACTSRFDTHTILQAERARINGFVDKRATSSREILLAMSEVCAGRHFFCDTFVEAQNSRRTDPGAVDKVLTEKQQIILGLIGDLKNDTQIACDLKTSIHAVEKQRFRIMNRLNIHCKLDLARYARTHGFVSSIKLKASK